MRWSENRARSLPNGTARFEMGTVIDTSIHCREQDTAISAAVAADGVVGRAHFLGADTPFDADHAFREALETEANESTGWFPENNMLNRKPQPPQPDRIRIISGSFSWIDHRFLRQGFDQGLSRLEKLFYFVLIAVSNCNGVSFYSDERLAEILEIRHAHELTGARNELVARDLIAFKERVYQVLDLPSEPRRY